MGATYTRQSSYTDGDVIQAADTNNEFDQLLAAFQASTGHTHDGTANEGGPITKMLGQTLTLGDGTSGTDVTITSCPDLHLSATSDINLAHNVGFSFGDDGEKIEGNGTDLTINSSNDLHLTATTDINIPANVGLTFGDDGEKIEG